VPEAGDRDYTAFRAGAVLLAEALAGIPPRVPVLAQLHEFVAARLRIPRREFFSRPEILVPAMLEVQAAFGLDLASITYDVYNIEAAALGQAIVWRDDGMPDIDRSHPLLREPGDLARLRTPDFDAVPACRRVVEMQRIFQRLTGLTPGLSCCAPFTLATNLRGIEPFLLDIQTEPAFAQALLDRLTEEVLAPWVRYQMRHVPGATRVNAVDATASPPIVNLALLRDWAAPPILRLRALCGPGVSTANWAGERYLREPEAMLDLKRLVGPGVLWGQDPDVEALGPERYKAYAERHDVPLILGVGAAFLATAAPAAVAERVRHYAEVGSRGGRFALYLCNLGATTPAENLAAAVDAAHAVAVG
jgi:uroporphyrinogen-III decarboxylase